MDIKVNNLIIYYGEGEHNNPEFYQAKFDLNQRKVVITLEKDMPLGDNILSVRMIYKEKSYTLLPTSDYYNFDDIYNNTDDCYMSNDKINRLIPKSIENTILNYCVLIEAMK